MSSKALTAASSRPLVLSILRLGESYGYKIIKDVDRLSGGSVEWTDAMLYPVLHRLEREGLIRSRWVRSDEGRRRKYYTLTPAGVAEAEKERREWMSVHRVLEALWNTESHLSTT